MRCTPGLQIADLLAWVTNRDLQDFGAKLVGSRYQDPIIPLPSLIPYGDAVVVIGIYLEKMKIKGKDADRRVRFTDTWIFQNSHWECVASQSTLTAPK